MGVTGLWTVVQPCARPIKIETLNKKRLAVDASIWIYQFLKAVRDKEGNALRNSHVVGFFRRICKLLFFGIKPVFVFDGGAPALKRQTISGRKQRREGRREDAVRTAGKLLALQMQRRAEEEEQRRREEVEGEKMNGAREEEEVPENPVYVDEIGMGAQEREKSRRFRKKDQYHLPELESSMAEMGQPNDPRVMSLEELEQYARQFDTGEDINIYDFSKIDFNGPFFQSLPATDRYNILNAARLRSRLRMGYSKDQLEDMFPDRMAFSRFQIERVKERNELTQRLMHVTGMNEGAMVGVEGTGRIAGEKGREYVLVRSSGAEGGWALGVIGGDKDTGERSKPIDVDEIGNRPKQEEEQGSDEEMGFEDVPIEGLNRLPKQHRRRAPTSKTSTADILRRRENLYRSRKAGAYPQRETKPSRAAPAPAAAEVDDDDALFVRGTSEPVQDGEPEHVQDDDDDEAELQRAIAMSLEGDDRQSSPELDAWEEVMQLQGPQQRMQGEAQTNGLGQHGTSTAKAINSRAGGTTRGPFQNEEDEEDLDFEDVEPERERSADMSQLDDMAKAVAGNPSPKKSADKPESKQHKFDGPLPFESLNLGSSLLGKKKMKQREEEAAGGFEKAVDKQDDEEGRPMPPWFSRDIRQDIEAQKAADEEDRARARHEREQEDFDFGEQPTLRKESSPGVIDVDALEDKPDKDEVISINSEEAHAQDEGTYENLVVEDTEIRMGDVADMARAEPPTEGDEVAPASEVDQAPKQGRAAPKASAKTPPPVEAQTSKQGPPSEDQHPSTASNGQEGESDEEELEWEASDHEESASTEKVKKADQSSPTQRPARATEPAGGELKENRSRSASLDFEDVEMNDKQAQDAEKQSTPRAALPQEETNEEDYMIPMTGTADQNAHPGVDSDDEHFGSDEEDEDLMLQMATEAEEHARFASQLNNTKSSAQHIEEYERELKALRSQQKKDRRDADEVTHIMVTECQQLLKLFGLPYITAPMEAEAQCAELVSLGLVDGIVTDDSDCFLFGGTRIYKNMFNQAKFVECYLTSDFEREYDLSREKMIRVAHLLGSDYTEGLPGIGPVTALEIISEFPGGLQDFRDWWSRVQTGAPATDEDTSSAFKRKFRRNSTKVFLPPNFPDVRVDQAYLDPEVDSDPSAFQWGVPDLDALRSYLMATIGWTQDRTDEVLVPVVRDMNRRENEGTQANITAFLGGTGAVGAGAFAPRRRDIGKSKRMEGALEKLANRAKDKRKTVGQGSEKKQKDGVAEEDVIDAGDAVIAISGSAVEEGMAKKSGTVTGNKRKAPKNPKGAAASDSEDDGQEVQQRAAKQKKTQKQPKQKEAKKGRPRKRATAAT